MPIYVDNREYPAAPDNNLLAHGLALGLDIPYFCWHPAMGSVGACRQCAVKQYKDEHDEQGRIVMACMTAAADGVRIGLDEPEAREFRARVIEWLMVNHPHDCPVCEEGGECHLQDMTVMTGHTYRRYRGRKRTFRNQYLGPFVKHEMNRCIACYRCVRFYQDYAGGADLRAFATHHHVFFGRHEDGVLESEFSGNLAEVCPTGVFTDKPFSDRYVRKWDLVSAPSVCPHCSLGCNTAPQERYHVLRRVLNRYNSAVNEHFICDRGRFGYGFVNAESRIRTPLARSERARPRDAVNAEDALRHATRLLADRDVIGIGSPRASLEANFALRRLVGEQNFHLGFSEIDHDLMSTAVAIMREGSTRAPSLRDAADADAVLVLGEDLTNTAPRLALTVRQAVRQRQFAIAAKLRIPAWQDAAVRTAAQDELSPLFIATVDETKLDGIAAATLRGAPETIARLGFAVAHELGAAPAVTDLQPATAALAARIAAALRDAERPLIVSGTAARNAAVMHAAANVARALTALRSRPADLLLTVPECNSVGLALIGGHALEAAFERARDGRARAAIVLENDLHRRAPRASVERFVADIEQLVVIDHIDHETARAADIVLPAAAFAEADGTLVSNEGRAQRFFQVLVPQREIRESWRWLAELIRRRDEPCDWHSLDDVTAECARLAPALRRIVDAAPRSDFRIAGRRINRAPARYSGRTAMHANIEIRERPPPTDRDAPFSFSMEGYHGPRLPAALIPFFWAPAWNSVQSVNKFQDETGRRLRGGHAGVRLLEAHDALGAQDPRGADHVPESQPQRTPQFYDDVPRVRTEPGRELHAARDAELRLVALHHIFGSEELSALSPPLAERMPLPYAALHPSDAEALAIADGAPVELRFDALDATLTLPVRLKPSLARGTIGLPFGLARLTEIHARSAWIRAAGNDKSPVRPA